MNYPCFQVPYKILNNQMYGIMQDWTFCMFKSYSPSKNVNFKRKHLGFDNRMNNEGKPSFADVYM
jgi:hypothetical protein